MPIPLLIAGAAAGLIGIGGHLSAKETNERAENLARDAKELYESKKFALERAQKDTETALLNLGYSKKDVLENSMAKFLNAYERVKHVSITQGLGYDELKNLVIDKAQAIEIREMSDVYQSTFASSAATGATAGAVLALAASGSLPFVTGTLSMAGGALLAGNVGAAAGLAGSALSFGAAMTPLSAIAAPVILFTGISASLKADENLEKARVMYAEAEAAAEQMELSETLCTAITEKAEMFDDLLGKLNVMFSECADLMEKVTRSKAAKSPNKLISLNDIDENEQKMIYVTRALAGAVKAVIDTPILSKEGTLDEKVLTVYDTTTDLLPELEKDVEEIKTYTYKIEEPQTIKATVTNKKDVTEDVSLKSNVKKLGILAGAALAAKIGIGIIGNTILNVWLSAWMIFSVVTLIFMEQRQVSNFYQKVITFSKIGWVAGFGALFYTYSKGFLDTSYFVLKIVAACCIVAYIADKILPSGEISSSNIKRGLRAFFDSFMYYIIALAVFAFLDFVGLSVGISFAISGVLYILALVFVLDEMKSKK